MPANISPLILCEICDFELRTPLPEACPRCQGRLKTQKSIFQSPDYASLQFRDRVKKAGENAETAETISKAQAGEKAQIDVLEEYRKWAINCPDADRIAAARDTLHFLQHVMHSGMKGEALRTFVKTCAAIGDMAKLTDSYLRMGGYTHGKSVADSIRRARLGLTGEAPGEGDRTPD